MYTLYDIYISYASIIHLYISHVEISYAKIYFSVIIVKKEDALWFVYEC